MENKRQNQQTKIYFNITFINEFYFKIYLIKKKKKRKNMKLSENFALKSNYSCPVSFLYIWMILNERILKNGEEELKERKNET